ncbi:hypothetical protein SRRS_06840 [Sporomusa rhizae]
MSKVNIMANHILSLIKLFEFAPGEALMVLSQVKQEIKAEEKKEA